MKYNKPTNFMELLELQKALDEKTSAVRPSGFKPRQRTEFDLRMALDDEFNEFMKELPNELNFKTWKEKKHDPHKQLIEYVDCLFFIAAAVNDYSYFIGFEHLEKSWLADEFDCFKGWHSNKRDVKEFLEYFKDQLNSSIPLDCYDGLDDIVGIWITLALKLGYTKETVLNAYWEKWNINMGRDKKDWSL